MVHSLISNDGIGVYHAQAKIAYFRFLEKYLQTNQSYTKASLTQVENNVFVRKSNWFSFDVVWVYLENGLVE